MKPSSIRSIFAALAISVVFSAFTAKKPQPVPAKEAFYYFYDTADFFQNWLTTTNEIAWLESMVGYTVNTSSPGGTLIAKGYINSVEPHNVLPTVILYVHF
jgi:hypothetical protein